MYFDSKTGKFTDRRAEVELARIVTDPRFDAERLPYFKSWRDPQSPQHAAVLAALADEKKSFPSYPLLGVSGGLSFATCEWAELGYGIFDGYTDGENLLTWLGPMFFIEDEKLIFKVTDWRARMKAGRGSSQTWDCSVLTASEVKLDGCTFDYCFDPNRYNYVTVPAGVKPSDVQKPCIPQYPLNVFGQRLTDPLQIREWELTTKARLHMLERIVNGNWAATTPTDNYQEDGVVNFFANWTTRQSEAGLTGYCLTEFAPVTTVLTASSSEGVTAYQARMEEFITSVSQELRQIEYRVQHLDGTNRVDLADVVLLMNPFDAECVQWYQACLTKCTSQFNVNSPSDIQAFWDYFNGLFTKGAYGGGMLRLRDGRQLSIMQMEHLDRGTVVMLIKGWRGSTPNSNAIRVAAMQYGEYYRRLAATSTIAGMRFKVLLNGAWIEETPIDMCGDKSIRWNMRLFGNAAWMQRKWTGLLACTDFTAPTNWPTLPDLPIVTRCTPFNG